MRVNSLIIDDFYNNPYEVREFALNEDFNVTGTFPGFRTKPFLNEDVKKTVLTTLLVAAGIEIMAGG